MPERFDLIVLGAGPAGSAAAATAAARGLSVALIDKRAFPRDKLCGGLFTGRSRRIHAAAFGQDIDPGIFRETDRVELWMHGARLADLSGVPPVFLTMRRDLDQALLARALDIGAKDFTGRRVASMDLSAGTVALSDGVHLSAPVVIGADGTNSAVARALFGRAFRPETIGFALEIEADHLGRDPLAPLRIDFDAARWGYGWSFPKPASTTIGLGGPQAMNPQMKTRLADYLDMLGVPSDQVRVKGHHIPFGDFRARPGQGAVLLAGDAAGLVDPITGEGIAHALRSGHDAALAAAEALGAGRPDHALTLYSHRIRDIHRSLRMAKMIRPLLFSPRLQPALARGFRNSKTLTTLYMQLLAGNAEYPDLARALVLRLPRVLALAIPRRA